MTEYVLPTDSLGYVIFIELLHISLLKYTLIIKNSYLFLEYLEEARV